MCRVSRGNEEHGRRGEEKIILDQGKVIGFQPCLEAQSPKYGRSLHHGFQSFVSGANE